MALKTMMFFAKKQAMPVRSSLTYAEVVGPSEAQVKIVIPSMEFTSSLRSMSPIKQGLKKKFLWLREESVKTLLKSHARISKSIRLISQIKRENEVVLKSYKPLFLDDDWSGREYYVPEIEEVRREKEEPQFRFPPVLSPKQIKPKRKFIFSSQLFEGVRKAPIEIKTKRTRLFAWACLFAQLGRTDLGRELGIGLIRVAFPDILEKFSHLATPQMDPEGVVGKTADVAEKKGNVQVETVGTEDRAVRAVSVNQGFMRQAVAQESQIYKTLVDRWIYIKTIDWSTSAYKGDSLYGDHFPLSLLKDNLNSQNTQLFYLHRYWRTGMKFRIMLNSNPFQIGMVVVTWRYGNADIQDHLTKFDNVYSGLQRSHCKLNAGSNNDGILEVPYNHCNSLLSKEGGTLGRLEIFVLNPLLVATGSSGTCRISVFASFEDSTFAGMIGRSLGSVSTSLEGVYPQMNSIGSLCNVGSDVLTTIGGIINRDNPPLPLQPTCLVPQAMPSFAYMDGVAEPLNILRADPRGQTPQPTGRDEMDTYEMLRKWGYVKTIEWSSQSGSSNKSGDLIFSLDCKPLLERSEYPVHRQYGVYPPVAVISSMFGLFRGDLEFRFEFVCSKFHTGRLMVGMIPGCRDGDSTALEVLKNSPHKIVDLVDNTVLEFNAQFYYENAWCRMPVLLMSDSEQFGKVVGRIINPVIAVENVSPRVYINIYVRGGQNFEVSVPRLPSLACVWDAPIIYPKDEVLKPYNKECAVYSTWERNLDAGDNKYVNTVYIQNVTDGWLGYTNCEKGCIYRLEGINGRVNLKFRILVPTTVTNQVLIREVIYGVYDPALTTNNAQGLVVICKRSSITEARTRAIAYAKGVASGVDMVPIRSAYGEVYVRDGDWSQIFSSGTWVPATNDLGSIRFVKEQYRDIIRDEDDLRADPQMNNEGYVSHLDQPALTSAAGLLTFGEKTPHLKSLGRRWIHYSSIVGQTSTDAHPRDSCYLAKVCVHPVRHINPNMSFEYDNRAREGVISLIACPYYLYRGGLRFRFMVTLEDTRKGSSLYVQHRFDEKFTFGENCVEMGNGVKTVMDMLATQYATFVQSLDVNTVASVEVPYYQPNERLVLTPGAPASCYGNGKLYIWVHTQIATKVKIEIYYSLADDMKFSVFQGFPPLMTLSDITAEPQGDDGKESEICVSGCMSRELEPGESFWPCRICQKSGFRERYRPEEPCASGSGLALSLPDKACALEGDVSMMQQKEEKKDIESQGWFSGLKSIFSTPKQIADNVEECKEEMKGTTSRLNKVLDKFNAFVEDTPFLKTARERSQNSGLSGLLSTFADKLFGFFTHIIYAVLNPVAKTIAWCLVNIYHTIWGFTLGGAEKLVNCIKALWNRVNPTQQPQETEQAENQGENDLIGSYASLLFVGLVSLCKLKATPPTSWKGIDDNLFRLGTSARQGMNVGEFLKDNLELLRRVTQRVIGFFGFSSPNMALLNGIEDERLKDWLIESTVVLDPTNKKLILSRHDWAMKVFVLGVTGRALQLCVLSPGDSPVVAPIIQMVNRNLAGIQKLENEMINMNVFSAVRYEPFCLWVSGGAGVGKTRFVESVADRFAQGCAYTGAQNYHVVTPGQKYFDNFVDQPSILIDDFGCLSAGADPETYAQFLVMKSSALLNLPYAEADRKNVLCNFQNLLITSNKDCVTPDPGIHDQDPYNRRRDLVLKFQLKKRSVTGNLVDSFTVDQLERLEHVEVYRCRNPLDTSSNWEKIEEIPDRPYGEVVMEYVLKVHKQYHEREIICYQRKAKKLLERLTQKGDSERSFDDYLAAFKKLLDPEKTGAFAGLSDWEKGIKQQVDKFVVPQGNKDGDLIDLGAKLKKKNEEQVCIDGLHPVKILDLVEDGYLVEPLDREKSGYLVQDQRRVKVTSLKCLHTFYECKAISYSPELQLFYREVEELGDIVSVRDGVCQYLQNGALRDHPNCCYRFEEQKRLFRSRVFLEAMREEPALQTVLSRLHPHERMDILKQQNLPLWFNDFFEPERVGKRDRDALAARITRTLNKQQGRVEVIGEVVVPAQPLWKRVSLKTWEFVKGFLRVISKIIKAVIVVVGIFFSIAIVIGMTTSRVEGQIHPSGDYKSLKTVKNVRQKALNLVASGQMTIVDDQEILNTIKKNSGISSIEGIKRKIFKNTFWMVGQTKITDQVVRTIKSRCIGLQGRKFLVLKHYIEHFKNMGVEEVFVVYSRGEAVIRYGLNEIAFEWTNQGYGVGELPLSSPRQFANIIKYMPSEKYSGEYPYNCEVWEMELDSISVFDVRAKPISNPITVAPTDTQTAWTINQGFSYGWGGSGRCGSLLIAPAMACPLVGVHTSGRGTSVGFSELLLRETFGEEVDFPVEYVTPQLETRDSVYTLDGEYEVIGSLDTDLSVFGSSETKIEPSSIAGVFPITTEPAPLKKSDPRLLEPIDPFYVGVSKRCKKLKEFPADDMWEAYRDVCFVICTNVVPVRYPGVLSVKQAIEGFPVEGYDKMEMTTSEGYPWVKMRPRNATDKSWMFKLGVYDDGRIRVDGVSQELLSVIELKEKMRDRGLVPASYFTACLKDARISKEKIPISGKTRIFEISPVDLTIAQRQYFLDFNVAYKKARFSAENTIGINCEGPEWTFLAQSLLNFSPYILTADYSGYGPRMWVSLLMRTFDVSMAWYDQFSEDEQQAMRDFRIRRAISHEVARGLHVAKDLVFRPVAGMPSGNPDTVERNSLANSMYIRMAYLSLARENAQHYADMYWFKKMVLLFHNGDDLIMSVKPEIVRWFNNVTLIEYFSRYGLIMTDAAKSGVVREHCSLEEATYLKRGFEKHPKREGEWMAPLEENSILDTANWVWRSVNKKSASLVNSEMCARLAYTRGEKFYNYVVQRLREVWQEQGEIFDAPSWHSLDCHVWEGTPGPLFSFGSMEQGF